MTEKERIIAMMQKHKAYFENVKGVDIAFSTKGEYFFYEYDENHSSYITFIKFSTAEELEQIIEESIATEYCVNLQEICESMLQETDILMRQEIDVTEISGLYSSVDRTALINAFTTFTSVIDKVYERTQPFKKWVEDLTMQKD